MRLLKFILAVVVAAWAVALYQTRQLPQLADLVDAVRREPAQRALERAPFEFEYQGLGYEVRPVASYELHGVVVSHNDPTGLGDLTHDETSVDTRDLCVIWGANLKSDDYRRISFESTPTWCHASWPGGVTFDMNSISNNHLVTNREELRQRLVGVHIGDQIRFRGMLVNYHDQRYADWWRRSSTTRTDTGDGACEVVFFEELDVLKRHAPRAWQVRKILPWVAAALLGLMLAVAMTTDPKFR